MVLFQFVRESASVCVNVDSLSLLFSHTRMRLFIVMLLAAAIAAPQLQTLHGIDVAQPHPPSPPSTNSPDQSPLPMLRRPPPGDNAPHVRDISAYMSGELEQFAKYGSAAYLYLCLRPLGNTLVRSVSCVHASRLLVCLLGRSVAHFGCLLWFSNVRTRAWFVSLDDRRREIVVASPREARSLRIWSLVSVWFPYFASFLLSAEAVGRQPFSSYMYLYLYVFFRWQTRVLWHREEQHNRSKVLWR